MQPGGCTKYIYAKGGCLPVINLKAASIKGGVKLTWSKSAGAEGYLVFEKSARGDGYAKAKWYRESDEENNN